EGPREFLGGEQLPVLIEISVNRQVDGCRRDAAVKPRTGLGVVFDVSRQQRMPALHGHERITYSMHVQSATEFGGQHEGHWIASGVEVQTTLPESECTQIRVRLCVGGLSLHVACLPVLRQDRPAFEKRWNANSRPEPGIST